MEGLLPPRRLTPDDAHALLSYLREVAAEKHDTILERSTFPDEEQERGWLRSRSGDNGAIFAAELPGSRIVGIAECIRPGHPQARHNAELGVSVLRDFQRRGIATSLIGRLIDWCGASGVRHLRLEVMAHHHGGIALYRRLGFVEEGRKRGYVVVGHRHEDLVLMARPISAS